MHVILKSFRDRDTKEELYRVILRTDAGDMSARPTASIADAMDRAKRLCRQLSLPSYEMNGKNIAVSKAA